jgi:hypothetical protein
MIMYDKDVGWGLTTQVNTIEYIGWLLTTSDRAVERAIVCLYNRQTADEKSEGNTKHSNGRGFSASDAPKGSYMAKWILSGKHLTGQYMIDAKMMSFKYINQLVDEATIKLERKAKMEQEAISARIDKEVAEELAILKSEAEEA